MATDLRDPLTQAIQAIDWPDDIPVDAGQLVSRAVATRKRRKRSWILTGATVAVLAVVGGAWLEPRDSNDTPAPSLITPAWQQIPQHYKNVVSGELTFSAPSGPPRITAEQAIARFCQANCALARAWYGHIVGHYSEHFRRDAWFVVSGPHWMPISVPYGGSPGPGWAYAVDYGVVDGGNGALLDDGGAFSVHTDELPPSSTPQG